MSVAYESHTILTPFWDPDNGIYLSWTVYYTFMTLLWTLMGLMVFWFVLIVRVMLKVLNGVGADDDRSDDEIEAEEEEKAKQTNGERASNGTGWVDEKRE